MTHWDDHDTRRGGYYGDRDPRCPHEPRGGAYGGHPAQGGPPSGWNGGGHAYPPAPPPPQPDWYRPDPYSPSPSFPPSYHGTGPSDFPSASYHSYGQPWAPPPLDYGPYGTALANPFSAPFQRFPAAFHPTPPAYAPVPFAPTPSTGYDRRDDRGGRWEGERRRFERDEGNRGAWREDEYRPAQYSERSNARYDRTAEQYSSAPRRSFSPPRRRAPSRSPSPAPYQTPAETPAYGANGEYLPPARRVRKDARTAPIVPPTESYLAASLLPSTTLAADAPVDPLVLVMDLNHTLLVRSKRDRMSSRMPVARPYLSTFLSYICARAPEDGTARFDPIVYSSARAGNVLSMLAALSLVPPQRAAAFNVGGGGGARAARTPAYDPSPEEGDVLRLVFTREMMGLSNADYNGDVETVKDLGRVWDLLGFGGEVEAREMGKKRDETAEVARRKEELAAGEVGALESGAADEAQQPAGDALPDKPLRLNKKAKARVVQARDERGARRTLLLDDEASKVAQQPYSHLPIAPFLVHPSHFPSAPPSPSRASHALSLDPALPPAQDSALLVAIAQLERARRETNVAAWVRAGGLQQMRVEARKALAAPGANGEADVKEEQIDAELARRGEEICAAHGVEVRREWDPEWRVKLLEKEGRLPAQAKRDGGRAEAAV
ncbi:hypothetical protein JCM10449v2_007727 [Rhodotorula kratochvilovae]